MSRRSWVTCNAVAVALLAGWGGAFATGRVSPAAGARVLAAAARRALPGPAAANPAALALRPGQQLPDSLTRALHALFGDYAALLAVRAPDTPRRASELHYAEVLAERYRTSGLATAAVGDSAGASVSAREAARVLGLLATRGAAVLVAGNGSVRFAASAEPTPDLMRQLVERALLDHARTRFTGASTDPAEWQRRLEAARLTTIGGTAITAAEALASAERVVIFDAHCSACRVRADLALLRRAAASAPGARVVALFASHYRTLLDGASLDSAGVGAFLAKPGLAPELAYISRDVPESAPVVLVLEAGRVVRVETLGRDGGGAS